MLSSAVVVIVLASFSRSRQDACPARPGPDPGKCCLLEHITKMAVNTLAQKLLEFILACPRTPFPSSPFGLLTLRPVNGAHGHFSTLCVIWCSLFYCVQHFPAPFPNCQISKNFKSPREQLIFFVCVCVVFLLFHFDYTANAIKKQFPSLSHAILLPRFVARHDGTDGT